MKCLIVGVVSLPNYVNKKDQLDPSVVVHFLTKIDNGFQAPKRPAFLSCSSDTFNAMLKVAGNIESMINYYANVSYNESGFIDDITLLEPSGATIPWKK